MWLLEMVFSYAWLIEVANWRGPRRLRLVARNSNILVVRADQQ
jgi:hypothetical protein